MHPGFSSLLLFPLNGASVFKRIESEGKTLRKQSLPLGSNQSRDLLKIAVETDKAKGFMSSRPCGGGWETTE